MTVVLANGCFDILHFGHVLHLEAASQLGDRLVVSITSDNFVNKGPGRPYFGQDLRALVVQSLRCVSRVIIVEDSYEALKIVSPHVFVKGMEYEGNLQQRDLEYCRKHGVQIVFTDEPTYSTTKILNDRLRQN